MWSLPWVIYTLAGHVGAPGLRGPSLSRPGRNPEYKGVLSCVLGHERDQVESG